MATAEYTEETSPHNSGSDVVYDNICQSCENDGKILEAEGRCEDCDEFLCKRCFVAHTVPTISKHHVMTDNEQLLKNRQTLSERKDQCTQRCSQHRDEIVKYYCPTHSYLGCNACIILNHKSCDGTIYIPDAAKDILNSPGYKEYKANQSALQTKLKEIEANVAERTDFVKKKQRNAVERIRNFRKEIDEELEKAEKEAVEKVDKIGSEKLETLIWIQSTSTALNTNIGTMVSEIQGLENKQQFCNLFIALTNAHDKQREVNKQLDEIDCRNESAIELGFKPNFDLDDALRTTGIGGIYVQNKVVDRVAFQSDIDIKSESDEKTCSIFSSVILLGHRMLLSDVVNKKIILIDTRQKKRIGELGMPSKPWNITVTDLHTGHVAVTLPGVKTIAFVQTHPVLSQTRKIIVDGQCIDIAHHHNTLTVLFRDPNEVVILNMKGDVLRKVLINDSEKSLLNKPLYLAIQSVEKTMYISNNSGNNVICVGLDGTVVGNYKDSELKSPTGMTVDNAGMVYVCDCKSHTVHQITKDCKKKRLLLTKSDGLDKPYTISYAEEKDLFYIGMRDSNIIKVFKAVGSSEK